MHHEGYHGRPSPHAVDRIAQWVVTWRSTVTGGHRCDTSDESDNSDGSDKSRSADGFGRFGRGYLSVGWAIARVADLRDMPPS